MSLVNELIKGLLPEEEKKKVVAVYGGGFKPPTSGHFEVVKQALKENPEIDEFIILIGGKPRNGITPDESILIWDIYKTYLPFKVEVKYTSVPPIKGIYNYAKEHPDEEVLFIIGAREGNEDDFKDIASRTTTLDKYPNLNLRTIVTQGGVSGTAARNASKISLEKFKPFVPSELSDEEVEQVYNIVANKIQENKPQDGKAAPYGSGYDEVEEGRKKKKDPKKGTGKKPKKSGRRLYTDEDPKDTVGIKFSTRQDIVDTLNKKSFKAKSHARQSQIINLIHQRVRAAYGRAKDPAVKKRLKTGLDYITKRKEASKKKTQRLKKQKLNENQMSQDDFNTIGNVLRDSSKAKQIHALLVQMFPQQKELLNYNYKNDSYAEFKRFIFHIDKYKLEGPVSINHTDLKLDPQVMKDRERKYQEYIDGKIDKYFRDSNSDPRTLDLSKMPPITVDSEGEVMDGNHRAFLAIKQQKPLKGYKIVDATNTHPNVKKILQIVGKENIKEGDTIEKYNVNESENKEYFDFQIRIKNDSYDDLDTTFSNMDGRIQKSSTSKDGNPLIFNYRNVPSLVKAAFKAKNDNSEILIYNDESKGKVYPLTIENIKLIKRPTSLKENASYTNNIDILKHIDDLTRYMIYNGMNIQPLPTLELIDGDTENAKDFFGKTAYYDPNKQHIVLYTEGRHPKDIVRSYAHEMIHHIQHLEDRLKDITTTDTTSSEHLTKLEKEANLRGTMTFRNWTDTILNEGKKKDPFGLMAYARELGNLREEESEYKVYLDMDGVLADFDQRFRDISGMEPRDFENKYGRKEFWNLIDEENKIKFWVGIPVMDGAAALVNAVKDYNYELLTSPSAKKQSYLGKILWVKNHTGSVFPSKPRINFKRAKEKHEVKPQLSQTDILIDDREDTIGRWNAAGGTGIVYKSVGQVLNDLKKLGL